MAYINMCSDPCGLLCVVTVYLSYPIFGYLGIFKGIYLYYPAPGVFASGFVGLLGLSAISHLLAMVSDPGYTDRLVQPLLYEESVCLVCLIGRAPRTHHCRRCKKCVQNMDHHCQWINNCVGFKNQKCFILFLVYTLVLITWYFSIVITRLILCDKDFFDGFMILSSTLWAFFFALLSGLALKDQMHTVLNNVSEIDTLQKRKFLKVNPTQRPLKENLEEVFGGPFSLYWFFPFPINTALKPIVSLED